jgi:hypothetical protein
MYKMRKNQRKNNAQNKHKRPERETSSVKIMNSEPECTPKQSKPSRQRPPPEPADVTAQEHELESQSNREHVHTLRRKGGGL